MTTGFRSSGHTLRASPPPPPPPLPPFGSSSSSSDEMSASSSKASASAGVIALRLLIIFCFFLPVTFPVEFLCEETGGWPLAWRESVYCADGLRWEGSPVVSVGPGCVE